MSSLVQAESSQEEDAETNSGQRKEVSRKAHSTGDTNKVNPDPTITKLPQSVTKASMDSFNGEQDFGSKGRKLKVSKECLNGEQDSGSMQRKLMTITTLEELLKKLLEEPT